MKKIVIVIIALPFLCCISASKITAEKESLYKAYAGFFPIGAAINPDVDLATETRKAFITQQYNSITPENQMKPKQIHPQENKWNWEPADRIVNFAKQNNMKVRGHALVWHQNAPAWMISENGKLASKEFLFAKMKNHIVTMMEHYKNDVYCWDVVNEAISDNPNEIFRGKDSLYQIAGEEYVEMAFRYAREADPNAQLFYNDYRFTNPDKRKKIFDLVKRLKDKGVPIDGVGMQSHYTPGEVTEKYLQETIDMFSGLGLKIQVTELDVSVYNYRDKNGPDADIKDTEYTDQRRKKQEEMYAMLFDVYRKNKAVITGVTLWGTSDMKKNFRSNRIGKMDYPFLYDENMKPKQVFYKITAF